MISETMTLWGDTETSVKDLKKDVYQILDKHPELRSSNKAHLVIRRLMKRWNIPAAFTDDRVSLKESDFNLLLRTYSSVDRYIREYNSDYAP